MSPQDVRHIGLHFFHEQDRLRGGPPEALCARGYTVHLAGMPPMDLDGHCGFAQAFYAAFPDLKHTLEDAVADGEQVAVRFRLEGTQTGDFMGIPATGRPIDVGAIAMMRVSEGRVVEVRGLFDQLGMLQQLGAMPTAANEQAETT